METVNDTQITDNQAKSKVDYIKPYMWKKGQSGNVLGRPKGKTMKEWTKEYLERMSDEERDDFMEGIPKDIIWKMAEGNPDNKSDITSDGEKLQTGIIILPSKNDTEPTE